MKFIGRHKELSTLENLYSQNDFQFVVIYGRRRIGKTALINKFIENKSAIYFSGLEENAKDNLVRLSQAINNYQSKDDSDERVFPNYEACFKQIAKMAQKKRLVFVIDEYPYLAASYPTVSSMLQSYIDHEFQNTKLYLILCGSSMSFMEKQVLGYKSPLYGRRSAQIKLNPFDLREAQEMLPKMNKEDTFIINTITGGIPQYLAYMSDQKSVKQNIIDNFLNSSGRLFNEPSSLLQQELRDPANYNSIVNALASGASKLNVIATKVDMTSGTATKYLTNLIELGIVEKTVPITEVDKPKSKKTLYQISDGMFRFWYTFVSRYIDLIERGMSEVVWQKIEKELSNFMGHPFEKLSQEYLWQNDLNEEIIPVPFIHLGNWWGTDPKQRKQVELDVVGYTNDNAIGYFGECKWKNEPISRSILEKLIECSSLFSYPKKYFFLFSKTGFTDNCKELAKKVECKLITFEEM